MLKEWCGAIKGLAFQLVVVLGRVGQASLAQVDPGLQVACIVGKPLDPNFFSRSFWDGKTSPRSFTQLSDLVFNTRQANKLLTLYCPQVHFNELGTFMPPLNVKGNTTYYHQHIV